MPKLKRLGGLGFPDDPTDPVVQLPGSNARHLGVDDPIRRTASRLVAQALQAEVDAPCLRAEDRDSEQGSNRKLPIGETVFGAT
jgi:hypothetical protein